MRTMIRKVFLVFVLALISILTQAQPVNTSGVVKENEKINNPYRILTTGKMVTIKSTKNIKSIMVWTSGGNRIIEDKKVNSTNYNFRITVNEKIFFLRVQLADGKTYSEKIGIQ